MVAEAVWFGNIIGIVHTSADLQHGNERFRPLLCSATRRESTMWLPARAATPPFAAVLLRLAWHPVELQYGLCGRHDWSYGCTDLLVRRTQKSGDEADCLIATGHLASTRPRVRPSWRADAWAWPSSRLESGNATAHFKGYGGITHRHWYAYADAQPESGPPPHRPGTVRPPRVSHTSVPRAWPPRAAPYESANPNGCWRSR